MMHYIEGYFLISNCHRSESLFNIIDIRKNSIHILLITKASFTVLCNRGEGCNCNWPSEAKPNFSASISAVTLTNAPVGFIRCDAAMPEKFTGPNRLSPKRAFLVFYMWNYWAVHSKLYPYFRLGKHLHLLHPHPLNTCVWICKGFDIMVTFIN